MSANPHDALFKAVFGEPEHARGALRSILPAAFAEALDWSTLARCPGSFVDPALRERHTDLLFAVAWRDGSADLVYLLFEHQSRPDGRMAYRLLRYVVRIWERWSGEHADGVELPLVIPIVLYHGPTSWSAGRALDALLVMPKAVRPAITPYLVGFTYLIDDLSEVADDRLRARDMTALAKLVAVCFKHARGQDDLVARLGGWADALREVARAGHGLEALELVMRYILLVNDRAEPEALQRLLDLAVGPEAKDTIMTAGERLIEQGIKRGIEQGIEQGIQRRRPVLLRLLKQRFGDQVNPEIERCVATASAEQLDTWTERVLSAATLTELLAG